MPTNGYQVAFEQAVNEIGAINVNMEKLTLRKAMLERLVDLLKEIGAQQDAAGPAARIADHPAHNTLHEYANFEAGSTAAENAVPVRGNNHFFPHDQVAQLAHRFWTERGYGHGNHVQDWLRAEEELRTAH